MPPSAAGPIRKHWSEVWTLIEGDAVIYVCGDGSRMEPDVRRTLVDMYARQTGAGEAQAERWMDQMTKQYRYALDVRAGN